MRWRMAAACVQPWWVLVEASAACGGSDTGALLIGSSSSCGALLSLCIEF